VLYAEVINRGVNQTSPVANLINKIVNH